MNSRKLPIMNSSSSSKSNNENFKFPIFRKKVRWQFQSVNERLCAELSDLYIYIYILQITKWCSDFEACLISEYPYRCNSPSKTWNNSGTSYPSSFLKISVKIQFRTSSTSNLSIRALPITHEKRTNGRVFSSEITTIKSNLMILLKLQVITFRINIVHRMLHQPEIQ